MKQEESEVLLMVVSAILFIFLMISEHLARKVCKLLQEENKLMKDLYISTLEELIELTDKLKHI